ncbi:YncE family protein [Aerosakkonemataceae cyanobacterium BLCC-F154]|uniref:YncE family protein n=1 Tax=Floridaenema fluviatile BLCC-F154 TaxID=3153640 RepID=A0ABV4Y7J3_9CYAN
MIQQVVSLQDILSQAQQGDNQAIATLINQALSSEPITAIVNSENTCLRITLLSQKSLEQNLWVGFIKEGMNRLECKTFKSVRVIGQEIHKVLPNWIQEFELSATQAQIVTYPEKQFKIPLLWLVSGVIGILLIVSGFFLKNQLDSLQLTPAEKPTPQAQPTPIVSAKPTPKASPKPVVKVVKKPVKKAPPAKPRTAPMYLKRTITGRITPKSIVHSGNGLFFAQNMMYSHTITVYNREHKLVKTIPDRVNLAKFGYSNFKGDYNGAPVEASFSHDGKYAWVSNYQMYGAGFNNPGSDRCHPSQRTDNSFLYRINTETLQIEKVIQVGSVPKFVATSPDNRFVLVSNWCSWDVSIIDTEKNQEIKRVKIGAYPRGIVVDRRSQRAYVAVMGSSDVAQIDLQEYWVNWLRNIGRSPRHLNLDRTGRYLYVSLNSEGRIAKIDLAKPRVLSKVYTGAAPRSMVLSDDGQMLYVVNYNNNTVSKVRTQDMKVLQTVRVGASPIGITYDPKNREVWVACYSGQIMVFQD